VDLLAQMTTFVRVVEAGSLSAAAVPLGLSLPAVSRQISALEDELGGALLIRTTRRVEVTEAGRRYYEHCLSVLREVDAAQGSVKRGRVVEGTLVVSAPVTFGLARVSPHVPAVLAKHPGLSIDLRIEDRVIDLVGEGVDVAIRTGSPIPDSASVVARRLLTFQRVVVASPKYLRRRGEPHSVEALAKHDAVTHLGPIGRPVPWPFTRDGKEITVEVRGTLRSNAPYAVRDAALAGCGIALLPDWLAAPDVAAGRLKILLREYEAAKVVVSGVHRTEMRGAPRVRALLDYLADVYAKEAEKGPKRRRA